VPFRLGWSKANSEELFIYGSSGGYGLERRGVRGTVVSFCGEGTAFLTVWWILARTVGTDGYPITYDLRSTASSLTFDPTILEISRQALACDCQVRKGEFQLKLIACSFQLTEEVWIENRTRSRQNVSPTY